MRTGEIYFEKDTLITDEEIKSFNDSLDSWERRQGKSLVQKDGYVYIDGEKLDENYGLEVMEDAGIAAEPIELGEDEYFVLGDNRNHSSDSRDPSVGILHIDELIGRAWIRIWPLDSIGVIPHE